MLVRCVPPHSSLLKSPIETTRTTSGYFSPKSIMAPSLRASAIGIVVHCTGTADGDACVDFGLDLAQIFARQRARDSGKSKRSQSRSTFEPCC